MDDTNKPKLKLSKIEEVCAKATPGPWEAHETPAEEFGGSVGAWDVCDADSLICDLLTGGESPGGDAEFIAMARTALPALLKAVKAQIHNTVESTGASIFSALREAGIEWR